MKSSAIWLIALIAFGSWPVTAPGGDLTDLEVMKWSQFSGRMSG
ncbi:hypothetical protein C8N35_10716 [Breoghania corrubedonensis]|uniref:Uncharacterized protein n=1 Tax=Breoghania corrubedonensis TaxID=665038 RepID=A0A2T5V6C3_9HYPH|nr:hypothetical protein [Breoghania corrubedonensis]PTW59303.1 hypothetical protein C8N35_10716 [Breoghania corrubedonensis]